MIDRLIKKANDGVKKRYRRRFLEVGDESQGITWEHGCLLRIRTDLRELSELMVRVGSRIYSKFLLFP